METTTTKAVNEIPADEKRTLEGMLGTSLEADQQVLILAYTPGAVPSAEARGIARRGIEEILMDSQAFAKEQSITTVEADNVVAEAMRQTRRRG